MLPRPSPVDPAACDLTQSPVPSPCVSVCKMDRASGWCEGCLRTIDEIASWSRMDDDAKRTVWSELAERRARRAA